jgi:hypothetical protein
VLLLDWLYSPPKQTNKQTTTSQTTAQVALALDRSTHLAHTIAYVQELPPSCTLEPIFFNKTQTPHNVKSESKVPFSRNSPTSLFTATRALCLCKFPDAVLLFRQLSHQLKDTQVCPRCSLRKPGFQDAFILEVSYKNNNNNKQSVCHPPSACVGAGASV